MGFFDAYKARKQEKLRERLLNDAYTRRAIQRRQDEHEREFGLAYSEAQKRRNSAPKRQAQEFYSRPRTNHGASYNPFDTTSDVNMPYWLDDARHGHTPPLHEGPARKATSYTGDRYAKSQRATAGIATPYPPSSYMPSRSQSHDYQFITIGYQYPRDEYVQPLSYGRRAPGETRGYRGRLFGEGNPPPPPPKADRMPEPVYGPPREGWF